VPSAHDGGPPVPEGRQQPEGAGRELEPATGVVAPLALLFNLIWASTALYWLTTLGGIAIFAGMTA